MRHIAIIFILGFIVLSCGHKSTDGENLVELDYLMSEKLKIAFIDDTSYTKTSWIPTYNQLGKIDSIIAISIKNESHQSFRHLAPDSIKNYYRQYIFSRDSNGDSIVYINAIYHVIDYTIVDKNGNVLTQKCDWQYEILRVKDGGDSYWQIKINLSKRTCLSFSVNGYA